MVKPWTEEQLNVPANINTLQQRLGYFTRRLNVCRKKHGTHVLTGLLTFDAWQGERMGLGRECSSACDDARSNKSSPGPPTWAANPNEHWIDNAVFWPPGMDVAAPEAQFHFLLALSSEMDVEILRNAEDLFTKLRNVKSVLQADNSWD